MNDLALINDEIILLILGNYSSIQTLLTLRYTERDQYLYLCMKCNDSLSRSNDIFNIQVTDFGNVCNINVTTVSTLSLTVHSCVRVILRTS